LRPEISPRLGLAQKLILALTAVVVVVGAVAGTVSLRAQERQLLDVMIVGADQLSKGITSATWHAMLDDNRQSAYEVMRTIALKQGIEGIRMFNRDGRVMFSTHTDETAQQVTKAAATCAVCHATPETKLHVEAKSRVRIRENPEGGRMLTMVTPIYNEPSCSQAACHAHPAAMKVLGVLDLTLRLDSVDEKVASARIRIFVVYATQIVLISLLIMVFTRRVLHRPIHNLIAATQSVSEMNLDQPIQTGYSGDELGQLAKSFDQMRERLRVAVDEINQFTQKLESNVRDRTQQLETAHRKLMRTDRLASLGQLSASVAHEINNPISGVLNLSMLMQRILRDDGIPPGRVPEFRRYLSQVARESTRVGRIVSDLLAFSRRSKPLRAETDLNAIIRSTVTLIGHKLRLTEVRLNLDLDDCLPMLLGDSSQVQQVVLNLLMNAAEATQGRQGATVNVRTSANGSDAMVVLEVSDNGEGITPENLAKIFDPFFTTKPEGKGVGLGLAVVYGIVQEHGGEITAVSKTGEGATFTVVLPVAPAGALAGAGLEPADRKA
jgi:two-component system, NtrC family, sensor kinase